MERLNLVARLEKGSLFKSRKDEKKKSCAKVTYIKARLASKIQDGANNPGQWQFVDAN